MYSHDPTVNIVLPKALLAQLLLSSTQFLSLVTRPGLSLIAVQFASQSDYNLCFDTISCPSRPSPQAMNYADSASYLTGSDSDIRLGKHEGLDSRSDTIYDPVKIRAPNLSPGRRGPSIGTISSESLPSHVHGRHTLLNNNLQKEPLPDQRYILKPRHSITQKGDMNSVSAPSAGQQPLRNSSVLHMEPSPAQTNIPSSLHTGPSLSELRQQCEHFLAFVDADFTDKNKHFDVFDWSEQQLLEESPNNRSPPRPKTAHGKKDAETRGIRSVEVNASFTSQAMNQQKRSSYNLNLLIGVLVSLSCLRVLIGVVVRRPSISLRGEVVGRVRAAEPSPRSLSCPILVYTVSPPAPSLPKGAFPCP